MIFHFSRFPSVAGGLRNILRITKIINKKINKFTKNTTNKFNFNDVKQQKKNIFYYYVTKL